MKKNFIFKVKAMENNFVEGMHTIAILLEI
jgi:hypothetical protein